jgi:recombinational DNA repair protein RecT
MSNNKLMTVEELAQLAPKDLITLPQIKERYITNYNRFTKTDEGVYHWERNLLHMERAIKNLKSPVSTVSVAQCLYTIAAFGMSADPMDEELYLIPYNGELSISRQVGWFIKERQRSKQISDTMPPTTALVYKGDVYTVLNGHVKAHEPKGVSNEIIAAYSIIELANGQKKHFTYQRTDWEAWRRKSNQSPEKGGNWYEQVPEVGTGVLIVQPNAAFLKTKILKHALTDKGNGWGAATKPPLGVEVYTTVFNDEVDANDSGTYQATTIPASDIPEGFTEAEVIKDNGLPTFDDNF